MKNGIRYYVFCKFSRIKGNSPLFYIRALSSYSLTLSLSYIFDFLKIVVAFTMARSIQWLMSGDILNFQMAAP